MKLKAYQPSRNLSLMIVGGLAVISLLLYKLGSLMGGLSQVEATVASFPVGWHGIYHHPLYLPLELLRSVDFFIFKSHGQTLTRLPNVVFGGLSIISFAWLVTLWHSPRTSILATVMFATAAWTLHVSRLASYDVLYLWGTTTLLLVSTLLHRYKQNMWAWYGSLLVLALLLYLPGFIWLILASLYIERDALKAGLKHFVGLQSSLVYGFGAVLFIPLLVIDLVRHGQLISWLGLPAHWATPATLLKQLIAVPVHLFIRGPQYPDRWLGRAPIMDIFALAACLIGIYFYVQHYTAARSRLIISFVLIGGVLVGLGGPVSLSVVVPLLYVCIATGLAYLLHEWLKPFPNNPIARNFGLGILVVAVALSASYNLRAYFVAWPHNAASRAAFHYRRIR